MALYRRGTASMDADGTVHGTDTKWKDQLALIRVGATIVFLEQPIKLAVISDIVSDTELKAISTDGQTAANGKYVILLNDSLTVNGLAQNVAETLRYYQSKETEIAGAMDIIASLDMDNFNRIVEEIKANKSAAESAQNQAELARDSANAARDEAKATKGQVQQIVDGAVGSINAAKEQAIIDVGSKESAAITHIDTEEKAAIKAINDAKGDLSGYVNNAQAAAQTATSAKNDAQVARDEAVSSKDAAADSAQEAKDAANSVDASNLLHKDKNLSDVLDKSEARKNLSVDRLIQGNDSNGETVVSSADGTKRIFVKNNGDWGAWDSTSSSNIALPVNKGGTGSRTEGSARDNLNLMRQQRGALSGNLNDLHGYGNFGYYYQNANSNATPQNNYPVQKAGVLLVTSSTANGLEQANQYYYPIDDVSYYSRSYDKIADSWRWSGWVWHPVASKYGVGQVKSLANDITNAGCQFISDNEGLTTWAATNGGGFQSSYDKYRIFQFWIDTAGNAYTRYNDTGDPKVAKTTKPWNTLQKSGTSDIRFKDVKGNLNVECALDNISRMNFKLFRYTFDSDERSARRGIIAQDAMMIDKEYVHSDKVSGIMTLDSNPLLMDSMAAIKALRARDEENKKRIADLESRISSLEDMIKKLIENK